jgi:hypothetical protein
MELMSRLSWLMIFSVLLNNSIQFPSDSVFFVDDFRNVMYINYTSDNRKCPT